MELILVLFWGAILAYIGYVKKETMQMTWLVMLIIIAISPLFAWLWPALFN